MKLWVQLYTNKNLKKYELLPIIPNIRSSDLNYQAITMERISPHNKTVTPDYYHNKIMFLEFDKMLEKNRHIALDLKRESNIFLDDIGQTHLVDFNIVPSIFSIYLDRYEINSNKLNPFKNIWGETKVLEWIMNPKDLLI